MCDARFEQQNERVTLVVGMRRTLMAHTARSESGASEKANKSIAEAFTIMKQNPSRKYLRRSSGKSSSTAVECFIKTMPMALETQPSSANSMPTAHRSMEMDTSSATITSAGTLYGIDMIP